MNIQVRNDFPDDGDGVWWIPQRTLTHGLEEALGWLSQDTRAPLVEGTRRFEFEAKPGAMAVFDLGPKRRAIVQSVVEGRGSFGLLTAARQALAALKTAKSTRVAVDLRGLENPEAGADAVVSAAVLALSTLPRYGKTPRQSQFDLSLVVTEGKETEVRAAADRAETLSRGTHRVRDLMTRAGNDLTPDRYIETAREWGQEAGAEVRFWDLPELEMLGAGAFCAVARSAGTGGILRLRWAGEPVVALVGKGITFDTGGTNLKTSHMFGMHGDMGGSAVALSLALAGRELGWKWGVDCYLAITENLTGPYAYRPNDVVTSLSGKTIEVIDTDAEGRMCLADTLALASQSNPQWIVDFATLTGSCIRAVGTRYSGAYTNRPGIHSDLIQWGRESGERIWPFPLDPDLSDLKSDVADLRQCRPSGGVDHLEAASFLREFVGPKIGWVHLDLASAECEGGLAHVPTKVTGFGVRVGARIVESLMGSNPN